MRGSMHIILNHSSMVPIYEQLMEQIKSDIIQSELKEGEASVCEDARRGASDQCADGQEGLR